MVLPHYVFPFIVFDVLLTDKDYIVKNIHLQQFKVLKCSYLCLLSAKILFPCVEGYNNLGSCYVRFIQSNVYCVGLCQQHKSVFILFSSQELSYKASLEPYRMFG